MRFDKWFIFIGFLWLIGGMVFGEWMGATENLQYHPLHAHVNLAGGVLSILFGSLHRLYPALSKARLALPQFLITMLALPVMIYGLWGVLHDPKHPALAIGGSMVFLAGVLLFLVMFVGKVLMAKNEA